MLRRLFFGRFVTVVVLRSNGPSVSTLGAPITTVVDVEDLTTVEC